MKQFINAKNGRQALVLVVLFTLGVGCKKGDGNENNPNSFKIDNTTYTPTIVTVSGGSSYNLSAHAYSGNILNAINFYFKGNSAPSPGTYRVIGAASPSAGEVYFTATTDNTATSGTDYISMDNQVVMATVSVNNNKMNISLPDSWARRTTSGSGPDSVKISANVTQTQ